MWRQLFCLFTLLIVIPIRGMSQIPVRVTTIIDSSYIKLDDKISIKLLYLKIGPESSEMTSAGQMKVYNKAKNGKEKLVQVFDPVEVGLFFELDTFTDFNNDGLKDIKIVRGTGVRGSNVLNYLYIQKEEKNGESVFEYVKGSDYPPNLSYDTSRKMIEATMFHGAVTFVDYKIAGDSLVELGGLDVNVDIDWVIRTHYVIDKTGTRVETKVDSTFRDFGNMYSREYNR